MVNIAPRPGGSDDPELKQLENLSTTVIDLIESGYLDDAARKCLELRYQRQLPRGSAID